jgi:hypothetical protein
VESDTSSELLLWEAIDQVREAEDGTELSLDELAEWVMAAMGSSLTLQQICTAADGLLVRDPTVTPELQEIGILELLQRYPCRGSEARWSPDEAIAFLETKARWLDAALESWEAGGETMAEDRDLIKGTAVVLVVPEQAGQPLQRELLDVLIPVDG